MPVTPTGAPAWVRNADYTTYGGHEDKINYESQGVVNPRTDVGAEAFSRMVDHMASIAAVADFSKLTVLCNDSSPAAPTIEIVHQMTGKRLTSYEGDNAPAGFPSGERIGDGEVYIVWDADYMDPYGVSGDIDIQFCEATLQGVTAGTISAAPDDPDLNTLNERVRVRCSTLAGGGYPDARFVLSVA